MIQFAPSALVPPSALTPEEIADAATYHLEIHPALKCCATLRIGFFFDGTGNNRELDLPHQKQSNIARLYDVFDVGTPDTKSSVDVPNRFATYVAGVGTPFKKEIGDSGTGLQRDAGLAAGWGGESRIVWALLQLQNHVHYFYYGKTLSGALGYGDSGHQQVFTSRIVNTPLEGRGLGKSAEQVCTISDPDEPGDGTVPKRSGCAPAAWSRSVLAVDTEHEAAFRDCEPARWFTVRAIVKIAQAVKDTPLVYP